MTREDARVVEADEYWPCPVKACRREGVIEMYHQGTEMFRACRQHAEQIWETHWQGWKVDWNTKKEQLVIYFDEESM